MKKITHRSLSVLALFGIIVFSACKKDKKDKTELLTEKTWKIAKHEERFSASDPYDDVTAGYDACDLDDIFRFMTNGNYEVTEGATKCDPSDPDQVHAGQWSFASNESQLTMDGLPFTIDQLDKNTMVLRLEISGYSERMTYTH